MILDSLIDATERFQAADSDLEAAVSSLLRRARRVPDWSEAELAEMSPQFAQDIRTLLIIRDDDRARR